MKIIKKIEFQGLRKHFVKNYLSIEMFQFTSSGGPWHEMVLDWLPISCLKGSNYGVSGFGQLLHVFSRNLCVFPRLCNIWFKIKRLRCPAFDKFDTKEMSFYVLQKRKTFRTQTCAPPPKVPWIRLCIFWGWRLNGERISGICIKFT